MSTVGMGGDQQEHYVWSEFSLMTNRELEDAIKRKKSTIKAVAARMSDHLWGQEIDSGTKKPRKGSHADDNDSDCCPLREKPEDRDDTRVTNFPRLAKVVEEMKISITKMQSQVDKLSKQVDKLTEEISLARMQQNPADKLTEQVGGFAQCLKAYDDHFAAIRRQLDCYFPCPP